MKKNLAITKSSTIFLRIAVSVIGLGVAALCIFLLPLIWQSAYIEYPRDGYAVRVIVATMYLAAVPFYFGIYKGWRILDTIDKKRAFSKQSVVALRAIAYSAASISIMYIAVFPFFYIWMQSDDAPGLGVINMFFIIMSAIISVATGLLARLLNEAVTIKSENDLTV